MNKIDVTRFSQPQGPVQIDWSNPITNGIIDVLTPSNGNSSASPQSTGVIGNGKDTPINYTDKTQMSFLWFGQKPTFTSYMFLLQGNGRFELAAESTNNGKFNCSVHGPTWNTGQVLWRFSGINITKPTVLIGTFTANVLGKCYYNGNEIPNTGASTGVLIAESQQTGDRVLRLYGSLGARWNRELNTTEVNSLSQNPWQIFKPIQKQIFIPVNTQIYTPQIFGDSLDDSMAGTESLDSTVTAGSMDVNQTDSSGVSESSSNTKDVTDSQTETVAGTDAQSTIATFNPNITENVVGTDSTNSIGTLATNQADSSSSGDTASNSVNYSAINSETVITSDGTSSSQFANSELVENAGVVDSVSGTQSSSVSRTEATSSGDITTSSAEMQVTNVGNVSISDNSSTDNIFSASRGENISINDSNSASGSYYPTSLDSLNVTDASGSVGNFVSAGSDSNSTSDSQSANSTMVGTRSDTGSIVDIVSGVGTYSGTSVETVNSNDGTTGAMVAQVSNFDVGTITETHGQGSVSSSSQTDVSSGSDTASQTVNIQKTQNDSVEISGSESAVATYTAIKTEAANIIDSSSAIATLIGNIVELVAAADSTSQIVVVFAETTDQAGVSESSDKNAVFISIGTDSSNTTDVISAWQEASVVLTDTVYAGDTSSRGIISSSIIEEIAGISDIVGDEAILLSHDGFIFVYVPVTRNVIETVVPRIITELPFVMNVTKISGQFNVGFIRKEYVTVRTTQINNINKSLGSYLVQMRQRNYAIIF